MTLVSLLQRLRIAAVLLVAVLSLDVASAPGTRAQTAAVPPIPPGQARIWLYRVFFAGDSLTTPAVMIDGTVIFYAAAGTSIYRDVPAGTHVIDVASRGQGLNQMQPVTLGPGQQLYVQIASMPHWDESAFGPGRQPSYAVMVMSPHLAALQMPLTSFAGGS